MANIGAFAVVLPTDVVGFHDEGSIASVVGGTVTILSFTVPVATTRSIMCIWVDSDSRGDFELIAGGTTIASGKLDETQRNISFKYDPARPIASGTLVELKFNADSEPSVSCPVKGYISAIDT